MAVMEKYFTHQSLGANKRERTRGGLLDSAVEVFARQGISNAKISDITGSAGLANGTFYNHFKDKDDLAIHTAVAVAQAITRRIDLDMQDISDAALRVVIATGKFLLIATQNREWGLVIVDGFWQLPRFRAGTAHYLAADLRRGADQGQFKVAVDTFLLDQVMALVMSSLSMQLLDGHATALADRTSQHILQLLGLAPAAALKALAKARVHAGDLRANGF